MDLNNNTSNSIGSSGHQHDMQPISVDPSTVQNEPQEPVYSSPDFRPGVPEQQHQQQRQAPEDNDPMSTSAIPVFELHPSTSERLQQHVAATKNNYSVDLAIARALHKLDAMGAGSAVDFVAIESLAKQIRLHRFAVIVLCYLQLFCLYLPAVIISAQHRDTIPENVRTFTVLIGAVFTVIAAFCMQNTRVGPASQSFHAMSLKLVAFLFETMLFAVAADWPKLFIIAIILCLLSLAAAAISYVAFVKVRSNDPAFSELQYTRYAATRHIMATLALTSRLRAFIVEEESAASGAEPPAGAELKLTQLELDARLEAECERLAREAQMAADKTALGMSTTRQSVSHDPHGGEVVSSFNGVSPDNDAAPGNEGEEMIPRMHRDPSGVANALHHLDRSRRTASTVGRSNAIVVWYAANRIRKSIFRRDADGNSFAIAILIVLFFCALGNVTYEFAKIFANQPPLFSDSLNDDYNDKGRTQSYFGPNRSHATWRVHMVVVDGLRDDMTLPGASAIGDLFAEPAVAANSIKMKMKAQLPSFSVPNWITLLSGAPPEQTGVTGNLLASETSYDHIFGQCANYNIHAGLTGTPWWRDLVFSKVPKLDGDGTIWSTYLPPGTPTYDWTTANPGDEERLRVALTAAARSRVVDPFGTSGSGARLYEFFLTHFSDVDAQGHEYGVDSKWNTRNTYYGAIANKTQAIRDIMAQMDSRTVLIVTSDHGHVARGGHGGVSGVLRQVPIVFYTRSAPLAAATPVAFRADQGPRNGAYENTDFAATVTALLGIPAPRQTTGIFMEEAVRALVTDPSVLQRHYYDLFRARYSLVQQLVDHIGFAFWGNQSSGTEIESATVTTLYNSNGTASDAEYGNGIRLLDTQYHTLRNYLFTFDFFRNLVCSILILIPALFALYVVIDHYSIASLHAIVEPESSGHQFNKVACIKGFVTVVLHLGMSIACFLVGYFSVTGYSVWDSTLTHTPSVAVTFLSRTVVAPVFIFVIQTRIFLFTSIRWHTHDTIDDMKAGRPVSHITVLQYIIGIFRDVIIFVFGTSRYRQAKFAEAYLYLYYLALWSVATAVVLLFLCFPFSFMVPVVFATPYVTEFNAQWRFRIITMLMLILPLLVGTALLLHLRPKLNPTSLAGWNDVLVRLQVCDDLRKIKKLEKALAADEPLRALVGLRLALLLKTLNLLAAKDLMYGERSLAFTPMHTAPDRRQSTAVDYTPS